MLLAGIGMPYIQYKPVYEKEVNGHKRALDAGDRS